MAGKGSDRRPANITPEEWDDNYDNIDFSKKSKNIKDEILEEVSRSCKTEEDDESKTSTGRIDRDGNESRRGGMVDVLPAEQPSPG